MRNRQFWQAASIVLLMAVCVPAARADDDSSPDEQREQAAIARFRSVLEANPRRGTALDRLYGYHVERGTLDELIGQYQKRANGKSDDGVAWTIVGLLESQRGRDAAAVTAFREAEKHLPENALPAYYLGQSLVLVGQPDAAAEAFERAIARKPNRTDLLDIFQTLGRVYQRAQRTDKALDVWRRLEELFPDDPRVQEQIASTLVEEGQDEQALPRIEKLARQTQDPFRKSTLLIEAAELKVRLKRTAQALADFEALLGQLNPESWLYRDVRRRIDEVFLRNDDLAGLAKYYEAWVGKNPGDIEAIARLARTLSSQGRMPEATKWLKKGIDVAPNNKGLRQALIDQLVYEQEFAEAAKQYEALDQVDPNNPDVLREWGKLLLRDASQPEAQRKSAAVAVWKRMLAQKPKDAVVAAQVADLVRTAGETAEATALYKKAIELAPSSAQYREYLGEYLHSLKRKDEALAAWRPIAEGPNHTAKNLARLAEVLAGFGYRTEALSALAESLKLEKDDFNRLLTYADLLHEDGQHDAALAQLDIAAKLVTTNGDEAESVLQAQIKIYEATDTLASRAAELQKQLDAGNDATAERWHRLARYYEAARQSAEATTAILKALEKDPKSVPILTAAARIHESGGDLLAAADTFRKLASIDRRFRTEHLTAVAELEQRLGRREQAMQAGRDLLAAAPGNPDHHKFFAELCFQLGDPEEGLESLRRSVRANPAEPEGLLALAQALVDRQRPGEAIELLWRALEKTDDLDGKLSVIGRLAEMYLLNNQFDRLVERLERERRDADKTREMTLCIASAYQKAGDLSTARKELERLLTEQSRDTTLLFQLSQLAESEGDLATATKYQRQLVAAAPTSHDAQLRLAQLLVKSGEAEEAADIWVKLIAGETEPHRNLQAIDQLAANHKHETVLAITSRLLARKPGDWELLYREGNSLAALNRTEEAKTRFQAILAIKLADDEQGAVLKAEKKKKPKLPNASNVNLAALGRTMPNVYDVPLLQRIENVYELRAFTGLETRSYGYMQQQRTWAPRDYGQARMAALAWLLNFAVAQDQQGAFIKAYRQAKDQPKTDPRAAWDWYYLQQVRMDPREAFEASRALAQGNDPAGQLAFLQALANRGQSSSRYYRPGQNADRLPPLVPEQLDLMLAAYRKLRLHNPDWATAQIVENVQAELKRAKRGEDEEKTYREVVASAGTLQTVQQALNVAGARGDAVGVKALFEKLDKMQGPPQGRATQFSTRNAYPALGKTMAMCERAKAFNDVLSLLDLYLETIRKQNQAAPKTLASSRPINRGATQVVIYSANPAGRGNRSMVVDVPQSDDYLDQGAIVLLRNAFEIYKKSDLLSDLFAHFSRRIGTARAAERVYDHLALGALHWWNDEKEEALNQMTLATQQAPDDANLVLEVADLREQNNEFDSALTMLDSIAPLDHNVMQRRERAALRLAERTGNVSRARAAAERLFGLRLDAETQVDLAGQMHRLGMHEMAETVLNRAQRQAGNRPDALVNLMNQYQSQNQADLAVQIARQILRRGPSTRYQPYGGNTSDDVIRDQAISVLARSGQLKDMIERAEAQLKSSPKSTQIYQALLDYYKAANDKVKFKDTALRMVELRPDDAKMRFQIAQQLQSMGEKQVAADQYKQGIKLDVSLYTYNPYQINSLFQSLNKYEELLKILEEVDLKKAGGNYYAFSEAVQSLLQNEATQAEGLTLLRKVWEAFPEERSYVLGNFYREEVWRLPEVYAYAKQSLLPGGDGPAEPWRGTEDIVSYGGDGKVDGIVSRTLDLARKQNRIGSLRRDIEAAIGQHPEWLAGKALLAIIDVQTGHAEQARRTWQALLDDKTNPMPTWSRIILSQELEHYGSMAHLEVATLEGAIDDFMNDENMRLDFSYSPVHRLVKIYDRTNRRDEARQLILKCLNPSSLDNYDAGYAAYQRIENSSAIANEMLERGEPVEAVRIFNEMLSDKASFAAAAQYGLGNVQQASEAGLRRAIKALKPDTLPTAARSLLTPRRAASSDRGVLDLVLLIEPRDLQKAALTSMFEAAFRATDKTPALRKEATEKLAALRANYPNDISVQTAVALAALIEGKSDAATAVDGLNKLAEATPLETLPLGTRANSRQRAQALDQVALWLVARECSKQESLRPMGEKLAARAVAAARRQLDSSLATAILREWGQAELDRGDAKAAESRFAEMIEVVLPPPQKSAAAVAPAAKTSTAASGTKIPPPALPVVTTDQFLQAVDIARLAAEKKMLALSMRAVRDALRGGPPAPASGNSRSRGMVSYSSGSFNLTSADSLSIESNLVEIVRQWRKEQAPPAEVYNVLVEAVLPEARSEEVFLYSQQNQGGDNQSSVCRLLVQTAVQAGQIDDLRRRALARSSQPLGELPAKVLLAHLAIEANDAGHAAPLLTELSERLKKDTLQTTAEQIGGVAMLAVDHKELAAAALPLLETAAKNLGANSRFDPAQDLLLRVVRYDLAAHDEPAARRAFQQIVDLSQRTSSRNSDNIRAQQSQRLAQEYLRAGWTADCLAELGKYFDTIPANPRNPLSEPTSPLLAPLARLLLGFPAEQRYELLRDWTLPTAARRSVRFAAAAMPQTVPPPAFGRIARPDGPVVSTAGLLIDAARDCGKLTALADEFDKLAKEKVENADTLRLLVYLAKGESAAIEADLKQRMADLVKRATEKPAQPIGPQYYVDDDQPRGAAQVRWSDFLIARACLADAKTARRGEEMMKVVVEQAKQTKNGYLDTQAVSALFALDIERGGAPNVAKSTGLPHWFSAEAGSVWAAHEGHVAHLAASPPSLLVFDRPLAGTFEFSVDAYAALWREGHVGYAGLAFEPNRPGPPSSVWPIGAHEKIARTVDGIRDGDFNRLTVQVSPQMVRCLVNGQLFYEDPAPVPTSPWVMLVSGDRRTPYFRNFELTGRPEVLREVRLSQGSSLGGWTAHLYPSQLPTPLTEREPKPDESDNVNMYSYSPPRVSRTPAYDWQAKEGEILGRKLDDQSSDPVPSNLTYFRPLRSGDRVRYEFFYQPGEFQVHPTLGRLAFLLDPRGVRLHWLCETGNDDWTGLAADNAVDEPAARRGPDKLPLLAGAWNTLLLAVDNEVVKLELNGQPVYERKLTEGDERVFGLFHYRNNSAARVRNVVLSGNWPDRLENLEEAGFTAQAASGAEARARRRLIGEQVYGKSAAIVLHKARELPAADRYRLLAAWVLPSDEHPVFQLSGQFAAGDDSATAAAAPQRRLLLGCRLDSPALELIKTAQETGKLDELAQRIEKVDLPKDRDFEQRCQRALMAAVRVAQQRDAEAEVLLRPLPDLIKTLPIDAEGWLRWPEYVAAVAAMERPALHAAALAIFDAQIAGLEASVKQKRPFSDRDEWLRIVQSARARLQASDLPAADRRPFASDPELTNWTPVAWAAADALNQVRGLPHWTMSGGALWHYPGYQDDGLYLRIPLQGDFELTCELTTFGGRESRIQYGGLRCELHDSLKSFALQVPGQAARKIPIEPPLAALGDWYRYRLTVKDGDCTIYVNDRKLCSEPLAIQRNPWLIVNVPHENTAGVRNLRIKGNPTVPERLDISSGFRLSEWRSFYPGSNWEKRGEEISSAGKKPEPIEGQSTQPRRFPERAVHYHRPIVEDGEIEYEFYFEPDKAAVHPLLDRDAFLLEPGGVRLHRLSAAGNERSGLRFDNVADEPHNRRGPAKLPLKEKAWNRVKLIVAGDVVSIWLNGVEIYQRAIDATNQRTFGLFHYADMTEARVRNVSYRGSWPKQLPATENWFATTMRNGR